ncbi:MAG: acyltransferase, partial [Comamonadaceae bacterium]
MGGERRGRRPLGPAARLGLAEFARSDARARAPVLQKVRMVTALALPGTSRVLISLQYARAVAALLVVYAHLSGFAVFRPLGLPEFGGMGVDLFFVISGFVMWESAGRHTAGEFVLRRVARIVPAYWFYTSLLVLLALAAPSLTPNISFDGWALAGSYLFIPYTNAQGLHNPILLQGWTLNYEAFFYGVFAISLWLHTRRSRFGFVAGLLLSLCVVGAIVEPQGAAATLATSPMLLEFVLGMAISAILKGWAPHGSLSVALAVAGGITLVAAEIFLHPAAS